MTNSNQTPTANLERLVRLARWRASQGIYDGLVGPRSHRLMRYCSHILPLSPEHQANILYTRDAGHHTGGWWKNPDYEQCQHLSISYRSAEGSLPHDRQMSQNIARVFWPEHHRLAWVEGPYSLEGRSAQVWHYRVFCDPAWSPILPRGEVYTRAFTEAGFQSFSEVQGLAEHEIDAPFLLAASQ